MVKSPGKLPAGHSVRPDPRRSVWRRKPWRQKGTGHARQGSTRPQWTHGGIVFAPKPSDYRYRVNRKLKRLALKSALSAKAASGDLLVVDNLALDAIKTKSIRPSWTL